MSKKSRSNAQWKKNGSARYKTVAEKNRRARLERHLKRQPFDEQAKEALKGDLKPRGARKPNSKVHYVEHQHYELKVKDKNTNKTRVEERVHVARVDKEYLRTKAKGRRAQRAYSYRNRTRVAGSNSSE